MSKKQTYPTTIDAEVRLLLGLMPEEAKANMAYMSADDRSTLHLGIGQWLRNHLGLWTQKSVLLAATGQSHPDDGSAVIITAHWRPLREDLPRVHCASAASSDRRKSKSN